MHKTPLNSSLRQLVRHVQRLSLMSGVLYALCALSAPVEARAEPKVEVTLTEDSGALHYTVSPRSSKVTLQPSSLSFEFKGTETPLLKIAIKGVESPKRWLKGFTESKRHPYLKGSLVRMSEGLLQIRTRYKPNIPFPQDFQDSIQVKSEGDSLKISIPSPLSTDLVKPTSSNVISSVKDEPKATSSEVKKIRSITAPLDDQSSSSALKATPLERGTTATPLPSITQDVATNKGASSPNTSAPTALTPTAPIPTAPTPPLNPTVESSGEVSQDLKSSRENLPTAPPPTAEELEVGASSLTSPPPRPILDPKSPSKALERLSDEPTFSRLAEGQAPFSEKELALVALLFVISLLSFFLLKRGKSAKGKQADLPFNIRSRHMINAQWNQEVLLVEVLDRTLLLGSSASGGLTLLAQLSPDPYAPRPEPSSYPQYRGPYESGELHEPQGYERPYQNAYAQPSPAYQEGAYQEEPYHEGYEESYAQEGSYAEEAYAEGAYAADDYYQEPSPRRERAQDVRRGEREPETDSYTLEVPMAQMSAAPQPTSPSPSLNTTPGLGDLGGLEALVSEAQRGASQRASKTAAQPEPAAVSADDLLQKIRQLNQG